MEGIGVRVGQMMEMEAAREPEERETEKRSLSLEDLRRKYSWWPSSHGKEGSADPPPPRVREQRQRTLQY
jgi:hypothetical protein